VSLHHALHDVEAETGPAGVPPAPAPELREHPIGQLLRDANTFVIDRDGDTVVRRFDDDLDASAAVPYRVLEQIPEYLVDLVRVQPGLGEFGDDSNLEEIGGQPSRDQDC